MLDHRMRAGHAELADDLYAFVARRHRGEMNARVHDVLPGTIETPEKIEMPPRAAKLAIGDGLQTDLLLLLDDAFDLAIFDSHELLGRDLALGALRPRLMQGSGSQQA